MKASKIFTFAITLGCFIGPAQSEPKLPAPPPLPQGNTAGRFALATVKGEREETLYRIDTATGETWQLGAFVLPGGATLTGWVPVVEDGVEQYAKLKDALDKARNKSGK